MSPFDIGEVTSVEQAATLFSDYLRSQYNDAEQDMIEHADGAWERNALTAKEVPEVLAFAEALLRALPLGQRRAFTDQAREHVRFYREQVAANAAGYRLADQDLANLDELFSRLEDAFQESFGL